MKIFQINTSVNKGSTGRIAEQIGETILHQGGESYIAYSREGLISKSQTIKIGDKFDFYRHIINTRLFDNHGFSSKESTKNLIRSIEEIKPDIIHLHNIHGYYIHIGVLFNFLKWFNKPVVWTFHDCWSFTGHCAHFENINCMKWKVECFSCPKHQAYPKSLFIDNSRSNFKKKKGLFTSIKNLTIVSPSIWLTNYVAQSFFKDKKNLTINNGIDLDIFKPTLSNEILSKYKIHSTITIILGVANIWVKHRGFEDFLQLSKTIDKGFSIVLVGLTKKQINNLPNNIIGIEHTENIEELVTIYTRSDVYINPTHGDTFPTTNIEALACGTPVITYDTGGSPEAINENTGLIVNKGDVKGLKGAIKTIIANKKKYTTELCRERAKKYFDKDERFYDYFKLYKELLNKRES